MLTYEKMIADYIQFADSNSMHELACETSKFVEEVREIKPELVDKFLMKIDLIFNSHFTKETATHVVDKMINKDGSKGEHWSFDTTSRVLQSRGYEFNEADWYYVLNMIYSDFYKSGRSDEAYIELACDFLNDVDAPKGDKAKRYWRAMHTKRD